MASNSKLMDTEPGGEQTQYEGSHTFVNPRKKEEGQFGGSSTSEADSAQAQGFDDRSSRGARIAENIRYGQGISEQGTAPGDIQGEARDEGVEAGRDERAEVVGQSRREQGYYGSNEVGRNIGA